MSSTNLGNQLNQIVYMARAAMFEQGELAQLTHSALDIAATSMQSMGQDEIELTFPVGYNPDKTAIQSTWKYRKEELLSRYQFLASHQLSINSIIQLVTITETMLSDIIRAVVAKYPQKLGGKRSISIQAVLESTTLEEVHLRATDTLLNELAYKSPVEFSEAMNQLLSVNLLECPAFHRYMEIKATRDIFIHNQGVANDIYIRKSGTHARVRSGVKLPTDIHYFLESYEQCLQISDWLEAELHNHWHSSDFEDRNAHKMEKPAKEQVVSTSTEQSE